MNGLVVLRLIPSEDRTLRVRMEFRPGFVGHQHAITPQRRVALPPVLSAQYSIFRPLTSRSTATSFVFLATDQIP